MTDHKSILISSLARHTGAPARDISWRLSKIADGGGIDELIYLDNPMALGYQDAFTSYLDQVGTCLARYSERFGVPAYQVLTHRHEHADVSTPFKTVSSMVQYLGGHIPSLTTPDNIILSHDMYRQDFALSACIKLLLRAEANLFGVYRKQCNPDMFSKILFYYAADFLSSDVIETVWNRSGHAVNAAEIARYRKVFTRYVDPSTHVSAAGNWQATVRDIRTQLKHAAFTTVEETRRFFEEMIGRLVQCRAHLKIFISSEQTRIRNEKRGIVALVTSHPPILPNVLTNYMSRLHRRLPNVERDDLLSMHRRFDQDGFIIPMCRVFFGGPGGELAIRELVGDITTQLASSDGHVTLHGVHPANSRNNMLYTRVGGDVDKAKRIVETATRNYQGRYLVSVPKSPLMSLCHRCNLKHSEVASIANVSEFDDLSFGAYPISNLGAVFIPIDSTASNFSECEYCMENIFS